MTSRQALALVRKHGVLLESAAGPVPSLAETVAGERVRGSWWSHPKSHEIFKLTRAVRASKDVLVCRIVVGRVTYVHSSRWPALVRLADRFPREQLAWIHEVHTADGHHVVEERPFPDWVPPEVAGNAARLSDIQAARKLGDWCRHGRST